MHAVFIIAHSYDFMHGTLENKVLLCYVMDLKLVQLLLVNDM